MSVLLCLITVSVFLHVNFVLKAIAMAATAVAQIAVYFCCVGPASAGEQFRFMDGEQPR